MEPATTARFALAARLLSEAARVQGLRAPGFRSPPRLVGADRTLRARAGGATVAVRVRGRPWLPVLSDMVEGVVAANRLTGAPAARARDALWAAVAGELRGEPAWDRTVSRPTSPLIEPRVTLRGAGERGDHEEGHDDVQPDERKVA